MIYNSDKSAFFAEAGDTFVAGQPATVRDDLKAYLGCAGTGIEDLPVMGFAVNDIADGESGWFKTRGTISEAENLSAPGAVYVGNTAGSLSNSAGDTSQMVAYQYTEDTEFDIQIDLSVAANHAAES